MDDGSGSSTVEDRVGVFPQRTTILVGPSEESELIRAGCVFGDQWGGQVWDVLVCADFRVLDGGVGESGSPDSPAASCVASLQYCEFVTSGLCGVTRQE